MMKMKRLGDVVKIKKRINNGSALPYVGMEHMSSGTGEFLGSLEPVKVKSSTFFFEPGQLLYGRLRPYLNKVLIPDFHGHCSTEVFPLEASPAIDNRYLFHWITSEPIVQQINETCTGARMPRADVNEVLDFELPLPPLPEQQRIVGKLDAAFAALSAAEGLVERNRANARELFESYLNGVFERKGDGWVEKELGTICEVKDGTHDSPRYLDEGVPFVTQKNIKKHGLSLEDTRFISLSDHENFYRRSNAAFGDILISMIGANRGMACIVDQETVFSIKNVGLVKHNDSINQDFLLAYLKTSIAMEFVKSRSKGGAQEFIGLTELRKFPIHYPHRAEQDSLASMFAELREETKHLETTYQQKLAELAVLKKGLLGAAFRGEL